jgi:hypothetical protein
VTGGIAAPNCASVNSKTSAHGAGCPLAQVFSFMFTRTVAAISSWVVGFGSVWSFSMYWMNACRSAGATPCQSQ